MTWQSIATSRLPAEQALIALANDGKATGSSYAVYDAIYNLVFDGSGAYTFADINDSPVTIPQPSHWLAIPPNLATWVNIAQSGLPKIGQRVVLAQVGGTGLVYQIFPILYRLNFDGVSGYTFQTNTSAPTTLPQVASHYYPIIDL